MDKITWPCLVLVSANISSKCIISFVIVFVNVGLKETPGPRLDKKEILNVLRVHVESLLETITPGIIILDDILVAPSTLCPVILC